MATLSSPGNPLKVRLKSKKESSIDEENLKLQAEKLCSADPAPFLDLLDNINAVGELFEARRRDANKLLRVALDNYPDGFVVAVLNHLQQNANENTRLRCAELLQHVFLSKLRFYNRLSLFFQNELKIVLFQRIGSETYGDTFKTVVSVVSKLAQVLLPKKEWPELYDFIFDSLKLDVSRETCCGLILLGELIPSCPEVFLFHIDVMSDAFKGFMDRTSEHPLVGGGAVKAAVALVLHLATPSNHEKYYDFLLSMGRSLLAAINEVDVTVAQEIIEDMIVLAQAETRFLRPHIGYLVKTMLDVAQTNLILPDKTRESAIEFVVRVAEDMEYGCGMIQNISPELLKRLFGVLLGLLTGVVDDPCWNEYDGGSDSEDESSRSIYCYAMKMTSRLVRALRENVIMRSLPDCLPQFLQDLNWQRRHAAITLLGLIADVCPNVSLGISEIFLNIILKLCKDGHPCVRWATIQAIGQFSKHWGPRLQGKLYLSFLPDLVSTMEDLNNPKLQVAATSTMLLFSKNCGSEIISPHLKRIFRSLCMFLETATLKEEALTALASLADTFQKEFEEYHDAVLSYLKVNLAMRHEKRNSMVPAKALECMIIIVVAAEKNRSIANVDKVIEMLINFQDSQLDSDDPMRYYLLQGWDRLCKYMGTDFVPYLSVSVPHLLHSAYLPDNLNSIETSNDESIKSNVLEEKAKACEVMCSFATALTADIHLWINEIVSCLIPLLTFKYDARVRTHAISAMPLMLHSASCAVNKLLPLHKSVQELSHQIIPALIDALRKETKHGIHVKILEALNKCVKISGSRLAKSIINQLIEVITKVLSAYSNMKTERKRRVETGLDQRDKTLLQEEIEIENNIYRAIADCLSSIVKIFRTSFLPMFDKLVPCLVLNWNSNSTEESILLRILRNVAEKCGEDAFKHYEERLILLLKSCDLDNPAVWRLVAYGISISAEFGGNAFKPHREAALYALQRILTCPEGLHPHNLVRREIAVFALGKICKFHFGGPNAHEGIKIWLTYLPLRNNVVEAKRMHADLCTMVEKSQGKVLGPHPQYSDYKLIMEIFAEVLWSGNMLATEGTLNRMKKMLSRFRERMLRRDFESICSSLPFPLRTMLDSCLSS